MASVFGQSIARLEDPPLLRGQGRFVDDIALPGMAHVAFVRSSYAHAKILSIDCEAARALPGVLAIWTAADILPHVTENKLRVALPSPAFRQELDRPILAADEVVHVGEPVVVIIAADRYIAEDAASMVLVDYDPLPAVSDCVAALEPGAPTAHSASPHNLCAQFDFNYGDVDAAFARAAHVFSETLSQHRGVAHSIEARGVVANFDELDDRITMWSSTQTPHAAKRYLLDLLRLDENQLRVVTPDVGGGFGPKLVFYPEEVVVTLAALLLKRPVKWIEDRREHFVSTTQERDQIWTMQIALDEQGHILGLRGDLIHDHGAWTARGVNVPYGSAAALTLAYVVPALKLDIKLALTNKTPVTPIRGAGQPQAVFVMERLLDKAARELKIDRAELRRRNLVPAEKMPYATPMKTRGGMQVVLDSGDYPRSQAEALAHAGWDDFPARQAQARKQGRYIGIGLANYVEGTGRGPFEPVSIRVAENGRIHVASGAAAMGQSTKTMLAQVVAEELGGDVSNLVITTGDTAAIELGMGGFNSRQAVMAGASAHAAAKNIRAKALTVASAMLDVGVQALEIEGNRVKVRGSESPSVSLGEISRAVAGLPGYYIPGGVSPGLEATERVIINDMTYANGSAVVEVEIDIDTGQVHVTNITFSHDCGRVIHPQIVEGQVVGGIIHGIGNALFEQMSYDENAQPLSMTLAEYLLVTSTETPARLKFVHQES
ncbi:MAG: xanthine dehydrogenase family protein molybdopterin-binding subunit, partial [Beijerinckiaceae bacterium]|nr:xanthine dehydrogenase family protein molybdopterin-binding subunit [Beijerinckiaceae bacterium]